MLNYESLLSSYDDKLTLMQWLKKVEAALKDASAVSFKVNKKGDATLTFSIVFEDGSEIESGEIVLQQGESVESAAIVNGHLILTLTNGDELDAGQLLNGDLNVSGDLAVSGNIASEGTITGNEIVENMTGYTFTKGSNPNLEFSYAGVVKTGNKITFSILFKYIKNVDDTYVSIGTFTIPSSVASVLIPIGGYLDRRTLGGFNDSENYVMVAGRIVRNASALNFQLANIGSLLQNVSYQFRYEITFLLSENLAA